MQLKIRLLSSVLFFFLSTSSVQAFEPFLPLPDRPPIPPDNPLTDAKILLGKTLFFDARLSASTRNNCNSCHNIMAGGDDGRAQSLAEQGQLTQRSAPTLWNSAFQTVQFWDGRAGSLEAAVDEHLKDVQISGLTEAQLVARIAGIKAYRQMFVHAYGADATVDLKGISQALASFIRTLVTTGSPFDRYLQGDRQAISAQAQAGFSEFIEVGCASCHFWVNLSGPVPGLAFRMGEGFYELFPNHPGSDEERRYQLSADLGRYYVTNDVTDKRMWRVPVLRNIAVTAPYFHNGSVMSLEEAIRVMAKTQLRLDLNQQQLGRIAAFLRTLTGEYPIITMPHLPSE